MNQISRLAVLAVAMASLCALTTSTAGAVTWHNSGDTAFTATGGPWTLTATSASLACTSSTMTATMGVSPFVGATWTAMTGLVTFGGCMMSGIPTGAKCLITSVSATTWSAGATSVSVSMDCELEVFLQLVCRGVGKVAGVIKNAVVGTTKAVVQWFNSTFLHMTNGPTGACPLGNGTTASTTLQTFTVTQGSGGGLWGPIITRTA